MNKLLTKEQAQKLHKLELDNINDGFTLPDMAYLHGKDVQLMQELGGDLYFSNYWYGPKDEALKFAEQLAQYFKSEYEKLEPRDPSDYDFWGIVMLWDNGTNAMVGNINLDDRVAFWDSSEETLKGLIVPKKLKQILDDGSDNSPHMIEIDVLTKKEQKELVNLIVEDCKEAYLEMLEEQE